jgi:hypothetical protein
MPPPKGNQNAAKPEEERQTSRITWKLKRSEKAFLVKQAQAKGMKLTAWLREKTGLPQDSSPPDNLKENGK